MHKPITSRLRANKQIKKDPKPVEKVNYTPLLAVGVLAALIFLT